MPTSNATETWSGRLEAATRKRMAICVILEYPVPQLNFEERGPNFTQAHSTPSVYLHMPMATKTFQSPPRRFFIGNEVSTKITIPHHAIPNRVNHVKLFLTYSLSIAWTVARDD